MSPDLPLHKAPWLCQGLRLSGKCFEVSVSVLEECCWQQIKWVMSSSVLVELWEGESIRHHGQPCLGKAPAWMPFQGLFSPLGQLFGMFWLVILCQDQL